MTNASPAVVPTRALKVMHFFIKYVIHIAWNHYRVLNLGNFALTRS